MQLYVGKKSSVIITPNAHTRKKEKKKRQELSLQNEISPVCEKGIKITLLRAGNADKPGAKIDNWWVLTTLREPPLLMLNRTCARWGWPDNGATPISGDPSQQPLAANGTQKDRVFFLILMVCALVKCAVEKKMNWNGLKKWKWLCEENGCDVGKKQPNEIYLKRKTNLVWYWNKEFECGSQNDSFFCE